MKKNFVRFLTVVAGILLIGCGKQQGNIVAVGENPINFIKDSERVYYEPTDEELEWAYKMAFAEAMTDSMKHDEYVLLALEQMLLQENYYPSDEERQYAYLVAYALVHDEEPIIQTMVTNVAINIAKKEDMSLIDFFFTYSKLFLQIHDGVPSIWEENEDGIYTWIPVTEDMLTDELKEAVDLAFEHDYTDGALHYYNIYTKYSKNPMPEEFIQEGDWIFY